jgi:hypothetical protein
MPDQTADDGLQITTLIDGAPFDLDECKSSDLALAERYVGQGYLSWDFSSVLVHQACIWLARHAKDSRVTLEQVADLKVGELADALDFRDEAEEPATGNGNGRAAGQAQAAGARSHLIGWEPVMLEHGLTPSEWGAMTPRQHVATVRWLRQRADQQERQERQEAGRGA